MPKDQATPSTPEWKTSSLGNYIRVDHDDGTQSVYLHLSTVGVRKGDRIEVGDEIGTSNNTGGSRSPHLHYTLWKSKSDPSRQDDELDNPANFHNPEESYDQCGNDSEDE